MSTSPSRDHRIELLLEDGISAIAVRIMEAALELFADRGFAGTSVREIVQSAEVTNPMLYYYFDSKEGLYTVLLDTLHATWHRQIVGAMEPHEDFRDKLRAIVELHVRATREHPHVLRFVYSVLFSPGRKEPCPIDLHSRHEVVVEAVEAEFRRAIDSGALGASDDFTPRFLTENLFGLLSSLQMRTLKELEQAEDEEAVDEVLRRHVGPDVVDRLLDLFLYGAGELRPVEG